MIFTTFILLELHLLLLQGIYHFVLHIRFIPEFRIQLWNLYNTLQSDLGTWLIIFVGFKSIICYILPNPMVFTYLTNSYNLLSNPWSTKQTESHVNLNPSTLDTVLFIYYYKIHFQYKNFQCMCFYRCIWMNVCFLLSLSQNNE